MIKYHFGNNSHCITYLFLFLTERTIIQNSLMETSTGRLQNPVVGSSREQRMGSSRDVRWTLNKQVYLKSTLKHAETTLKYWS